MGVDSEFTADQSDIFSIGGPTVTAGTRCSSSSSGEEESDTDTDPEEHEVEAPPATPAPYSASQEVPHLTDVTTNSSQTQDEGESSVTLSMHTVDHSTSPLPLLTHRQTRPTGSEPGLSKSSQIASWIDCVSHQSTKPDEKLPSSAETPQNRLGTICSSIPYILSDRDYPENFDLGPLSKAFDRCLTMQNGKYTLLRDDGFALIEPELKDVQARLQDAIHDDGWDDAEKIKFRLTHDHYKLLGSILSELEEDVIPYLSSRE